MTKQFLMSNLTKYPTMGFIKFEYGELLKGDVVITKNILDEVQEVESPLQGATYQTVSDYQALANIVKFAVDEGNVSDGDVVADREIHFYDRSDESPFPVLLSEIVAFISATVKGQAIMQLERQLNNLRAGNDKEVLTSSRGRKILRKISN